MSLDRDRVRRILDEELADLDPGGLDEAVERAAERLAGRPPRPEPPQRQPKRRPQDDPRVLGMLELRRQGLTLEQIGERYGLTRERIRQLLKLIDPEQTAAAAGKQALAAAKADADRQLEVDWQASADPCRVCLGPRPYRRRNLITCRAECAKLWKLCRFYLDDDRRERHRQTVARWVVNHPSRVDEIKLRSSARVLDGTAGRHFMAPQSPAVREALARIRELRASHT